MKVYEGENNVFIDVDGTLVYSESPATSIAYSSLIGNTKANPTVDIVDPLDSAKTIRQSVNQAMVRCLLEEKQRGSRIIVWSRGGWQWARNVVQALGIEDKVDLVMSKPLAYFDDVPVEQWLAHRVFIDPNVPYKR